MLNSSAISRYGVPLARIVRIVTSRGVMALSVALTSSSVQSPQSSGNSILRKNSAIFQVLPKKFDHKHYFKYFDLKTWIAGCRASSVVRIRHI
jgi:hypothetical protein